MWLYAFGFFVHLVFFVSVFDIYFRTPIVHGMDPQSSPMAPAAKRLVLIIADGLRADSFYNFTNGATRAPYLRSVIETEGTWGVSHTRVPTESRPGNVAILAGLYEDPSAIARGWRENPVHFDHVLNRTKYGWAWGSPDIVPMFTRDNRHIYSMTYTAGEEDFASADASSLDTWVFERVLQLFARAKKDPKLNQELRSDRIMFFLHLLGIDTNGHSHKPHSKEYQDNIELVDSGVHQVVKAINEFYGDNETAYVFTSDHGMTNWGSHGAGEASETETPIVAWGRGVASPQDPASFQAPEMMFDPRVVDWGLMHVRRHDVHQADITPLMASLINVPVPVNNMGVLPIEYLADSVEYKAQALFANARQLLAQYRRRRIMRQDAMLPMLYSPFKKLPMDAEVSYITKIYNALNKKRYEEVVSLSHRLLQLSAEGINYYHNYDRPGLTISITLAFMGWIALMVCQIVQHDTAVVRVACNSIEGRRAAKKSVFWCATVLVWGAVTLLLNTLQTTPWQYHLYYLLPVLVWGVLVFRWLGVLRVLWVLLCSYNMVWETAIRLLALLVGVQILVFSFHARLVLAAGLVCLGVWPLVLHPQPSSGPAAGSGASLALCWLGACLLLSSFTILPPVVGMEPSYLMVEVAGVVGLVLGSFALYGCGGDDAQLCGSKSSAGRSRCTALGVGSLCQGGLVLASLAVIHLTSDSLRNKTPVPVACHVAAWAVLVVSTLMPVVSGSQLIMGRLLSVCVALLCPFLLLSIRHEAFFYLALSIAMILWILLEFCLAGGSNSQLGVLKYAVWSTADDEGHSSSSTHHNERLLGWPDVRRAYFFLFFIVLAFFGIGNLASVNSFDPGFVYCFVTVFSPFTMGALLLLKILIPFLLVTCFFHAICILLQVPTIAVFQLFLVLSDLMALQFFLVIRTEGSWLAIGSSLSHFVISMSTTLFLYLLMVLAKVLTTATLFKSKQSQANRRQHSVLPQINRARPHRD